MASLPGSSANRLKTSGRFRRSEAGFRMETTAGNSFISKHGLFTSMVVYCMFTACFVHKHGCFTGVLAIWTICTAIG